MRKGTTSPVQRLLWRATLCVGSCVLGMMTSAPLIVLADEVQPTSTKSVQGKPMQGTETPQWISADDALAKQVRSGTCYFRRTFSLPAVGEAKVRIAAEGPYQIYLNGQLVARSDSTTAEKQANKGKAAQAFDAIDVTREVRPGKNLIAARVGNRGGAPAALALTLTVITDDGQQVALRTDKTWKTSRRTLPLWTRRAYSDRRWKSAKTLRPANGLARAEVSNRGTSEQTGPTPSVADPLKAARTGLLPLAVSPPSGDQLVIPTGFVLDQVAGNEDVGSLTAMTFDEGGNLLVASEDGTIRSLIDTDKDGSYDHARIRSTLLKSCQGLLALNGEILAVGHGPEGLGLYRLQDASRDGTVDQYRLLIQFAGKGGEHGPHGVRLGPDGKIYVVVGNHAQVSSPPLAAGLYARYEGDLVQPRMEDPSGHAVGVRAPGGMVVRTDLQGETVELVAGGLRNAYDLAFDPMGNLLIHDSDMESDQGAPWHRPTRLYRLRDGADCGWRSGWAKWPAYYPDAQPPLLSTGRGSPTGIAVYQHTQFPTPYRSAIFSADWSNGRIRVISIRESSGQDLSGEALVNDFVRGEPLNVTDLEIGPDGALYFCTGGRGTAGNVYRIHWQSTPLATPRPLVDVADEEQLKAAITYPQLDSAFARQQLSQLKSKMGDHWSTAMISAVEGEQWSVADRLQALQIMRWIGPTPTDTLLLGLSQSPHAPLRATAATIMADRHNPVVTQQLVRMLQDFDREVRIRAAESLALQRVTVSLATVAPLLAAADSQEVAAGRRILIRMPETLWQAEITRQQPLRRCVQAAIAFEQQRLATQPNRGDPVNQQIVEYTLAALDTFVSDRDFLEMLRLWQLALIDESLPAALRQRLTERLIREYPTRNAALNREIVRLLTAIPDSQVVAAFCQELESAELEPADRIHLALHLSRLTQGWTFQRKMLALAHLEATRPDVGEVAPYVQTTADRFARELTGAERREALRQADRYPAAAMAIILAMPEQLDASQRTTVVELDQRLSGESDTPTDRLKTAIVAVLARDGQPESATYLREIYRRDAPRRADAALGLVHIGDPASLSFLADQIHLLDEATAAEIRPLLPDAGPVRAGPHADQDAPPTTDRTSTSDHDFDRLLAYLSQAERRREGDVIRGRAVFQRAQCAACHRHGSLGTSIGPDLSNTRRRFTTREVLDAIVHPSRIVSDQYAAKIVTTDGGQTFVGIVSQVDEQTLSITDSQGKRHRLARSEADEILPSTQSVMPVGLLDPLSLQEVTDLFAFLMTPPTATPVVTRTNHSSRK